MTQKSNFSKAVFFFAIILVFVLSACGGDGAGADPPSASRSISELTITDETNILIEDGRVISLSPDGSMFVAQRTDAICIYEAQTLDEVSCQRFQPSIDRRTLAWSPSSKQIAFTEDASRLVIESDIWLFDIAEDRLENLTDDNIEGPWLTTGDDDEEVMIDLAPAWSPDGRTIAFSRTYRDGDTWINALYKITANGGDPEELIEVSDDYPMAVFMGISWARDGKQVYYSVVLRDQSDRDNGIWSVDRDGKNVTQVFGVRDWDGGPPLLMGISASEDQALVFDFLGLSYGREPNRSAYSLLDLKTGDYEPVKQPSGEEFEFIGVNNAVFSPDGSKLLYTYQDLENQFHLAGRDLGDEDEYILYSHSPLGLGFDIGLGLNWAANDTIYAGTGPGQGLLLSVGSE